MSRNLDSIIKLVREISDSKNLSDFIQNKINKEGSTPGAVMDSLGKIYVDESIRVSIERLAITETNKYCVSQDRLMVIHILSDMMVRVYKYQMDLFEGSPTKPELINLITYGKGDTIILNRSDIYFVEVLSYGIAVVAREQEMDDVKHSYCLQTGNLISTVASCNQHSKLQFAADLLGRFPDKKSLNVLKKLLRHKAHFVRWQAAQSYALIASVNETILMLNELRKDPHPHPHPHPHIRDAVVGSLQKVDRYSDDC